MLGGDGPRRTFGIGGNRQVLQAVHRGDKTAEPGWRVVARFGFGESAPDFGRCVGHRAFHRSINSSVVVMVASSDSVLAITAAPYSVGMPATASRGTMTR